MVKKKKKLLIGIIIFVITFATIFSIYYFSKDSQLDISPLSISFTEIESEFLDFCSTEQECFDVLEKEGITQLMLNEKGLKISCSLSKCYAVKI